MKQGTVKTLGVAALGAAFAAAAAGTASAATGNVVQALPVQDVAKTLPAGAPESLAAGQDALRRGASTLPVKAHKGLPAGLPTDKLPGRGLLGGLPVGGGATGLAG